MTNADEKIYDFLEKEGRPVSIGEICNHKDFSEMTRREIAQELQAMARQNAVFRSLKEGKAYYSVNSSEGTGRNAAQEFISKLQYIGNMLEMSDEEKQLNDLASSTKTVNEALAIDEFNSDEDLLVDISTVALTYSEGKTVQGDGYSMIIPDSFEIVDQDGRDFVAYLENPLAEDKDIDLGGSIIQILPAQSEPLDRNSNISLQKFDIRLQKYYAELYGIGYWSAARQLLGQNSEFYTTEAGACVHIKKLPSTQHFLFMIWCGDDFRQIHIRTDYIKGPDEILKSKLLEIVSKVQPNNPLPKIKKLDDLSYLGMKLTKENVDEWTKNLEQNIGDYKALFGIQLKAEEARAKSEQQTGDFSEVKAKKRYRHHLQELVSNIDIIADQIAAFIRSLNHEDQDKKLLSQVYLAISEFFDNNSELVLEIGEEKYREASSKIERVKKEIFTEDIKEYFSFEKEKRKREIEERKKTRKEQEERDKIGKALVKEINSKFDSYQSIYQQSANAHKEMIESHSFEGRWDPELWDYFSYFDDDIQAFGSDSEELVEYSIDKFNELNAGLSADVSLSIIEAIENVISEVDDAEIHNNDLDISYTYTWRLDIDSAGSEFRRVKRVLKDQIKKDRDMLKRQEKEEREFEEAIKYGIDINDLPKHRGYIEAEECMKKAASAADFRKAADLYEKIKGYLDSADKQEKCINKADKLAIKEQVQDKAEKARKNLQAAEKVLKKATDELSYTSTELMILSDKICDMQNSFDAECEGIRTCAETEIAQLTEKKEASIRKKKYLETELQNAETDLENINILAVGKKKSLRAHIETLQSMITDTESEATDIDSKIQNVHKERDSKLKILKKKLQDLETKKRQFYQKKEELQSIVERAKRAREKCAQDDKEAQDAIKGIQ